MGRYYWNNKQEADSLKQVSVSFFRKHNYFNRGWKSGTVTFSRNGEETGNISVHSSVNESEQYMRFIYTQTDRDTGEKKDLDYKIPLTTTPCNYGGVRYWFTCPWYVSDKYCGRRVGVLYLDGKHFACRHCHNLTYNSRNLSGISKVAGQVISAPELDKLESEIKRKYYAGKMTRKYKLFQKKGSKFTRQMMIVSRGLGIYP